MHGRQDDIGAFDTPKHAGMLLGSVLRMQAETFELETEPGTVLHNGDGLTYFDRQGELVGLQANRVEPIGPARWRVHPPERCAHYPDLRPGTALHRNRDLGWDRLLSPSLTTMRQPCAALGAAAVEVMLGRLRQPHMPARRVLLRAELVERESTAANT